MTNGAVIRPKQLVCGLLDSTLEWLSPAARRVVAVLSNFDSRGLPSDRVAKLSNLGNRHQLARVLARDGLPALGELRTWVRLVGWVLEWECDRTSLYHLAMAQDLNPAVCYRTIKRLTGVRWVDVRSRGLAWVLIQLRDRCVIPAMRVRRLEWYQKNSGGDRSPPLTSRQASGLTRTSARLPCWQAPAASNPRKSRRSSSSWYGTPWR